MAKQFDPWIGEFYREGIERNTILIVGVQHWCDPKFWNCKEDPHECLEKRNNKCTVWNTEEYQSNGKCHEWANENNKVELCPLYEECKSKNRITCLHNGVRLLQCETKISIHDHIDDKEKRKRARVFALVFDALKNLFEEALSAPPFNIKREETSVTALNPIQKRGYWNRIVFTNFIQHYTKYWNYGELNPEELKYEPEKNQKAFDKCIKEFLSSYPDVIVVLQESKIFKIIKGILGNKYIYLEEKSKARAFYILAKPSSSLYKKTKNENRDKRIDFIRYCVQNFKGKRITRQIEILTRFLAELEEKQIGKSNLKQIREEILDSCPNEIKEQFYIIDKDGNKKFNHNTFSSLVQKKHNPIKEEEMTKINDKYEEYFDIQEAEK